jgi:hypothetical protein
MRSHGLLLARGGSTRRRHVAHAHPWCGGHPAETLLPLPGVSGVSGRRERWSSLAWLRR